MSYPGGKNGSGMYQKIISLMPPHLVYVEPFAGGAAILKLKKTAPVANIAIDIDAGAIDQLQDDRVPAYLIHGDALKWLQMSHYAQDKNTLIYLDPPYLLETRSSKRAMYRYEMMTHEEHCKLLEIILTLPCMVMISGYYSTLYSQMLSNWRSVSFTAQSRGGIKTEWVWMNFPEPLELHDYRYLGSDYRERERIKKRQKRWQDRLTRMSPQERYALLSVLDGLRSPGTIAIPDGVGSSTTRNGGCCPGNTINNDAGQHQYK